MKSPDELTDIFRARGFKITPQRQLIFRVLHEGLAHPTAESVYARAIVDMPSMSLRTVYQTLNDLAAMGEVVQLDLGTGSSRFDTNLGAHQHLVCVDCGAVRDVVVDFIDIDLDEGDLGGFSVSSTEVVFRGRCSLCSTEPSSVTESALRPSRISEETSNHA